MMQCDSYHNTSSNCDPKYVSHPLNLLLVEYLFTEVVKIISKKCNLNSSIWLMDDILEKSYLESTRMKTRFLEQQCVNGKMFKIIRVTLCIRQFLLWVIHKWGGVNRILETVLFKLLKLTQLEMMVTWVEALKVKRTMARTEVETLTYTGNLLDHRIRKKKPTINFKFLVLTARCIAVQCS